MSGVMIEVNNETLGRLMALRQTPQEPLGRVVTRHLPAAAGAKRPPGDRAATSVAKPIACGIYHVDLLGERISAFTLADLLRKVLLCLAGLDDQFLSRLSKRSTGARHVVAREPEQLYPFACHMKQHGRRLCEGWWFDPNISRTQLVQRLRIICEVAGLTYGPDLVMQK
jgi:hypothetical protein